MNNQYGHHFNLFWHIEDILVTTALPANRSQIQNTTLQWKCRRVADI